MHVTWSQPFLMMAGVGTLTLLTSCTRAVVVPGADGTLASQGADAEAPIILSLKDGEGDPLVPGSGGTATKRVRRSSPLIVTFSEAMDPSSVTTENLCLHCLGCPTEGSYSDCTDIADCSIQAAITLQETDGIPNNEFAFTPNSPLPALDICSFLVDGEEAGVKDASGIAMEPWEGLSLATGCASSDDFNDGMSLANGSDPPIDCYLFGNAVNRENTVETVEGGRGGWIVATGEEEGTLELQGGSAAMDVTQGFDGVLSLAKQVTGDFDVEITLARMTTDWPETRVGFAVIPSMSERFNDIFLCLHTASECAMAGVFGGVIQGQSEASDCNLMSEGMSPPPPLITLEAGTTLRVVRSGSDFRCLRRPSGGDFVQLGSSVTLPSLGDEVFLAIFSDNLTANGLTRFELDDLIFHSGGAVGQD